MALQETDLLAIYRQSDKTNRKVTVKNLLNGGLWTEDSGNLYPKTLTNNVGIGTETPATKLHVDGKLRATSYDLESLPLLGTAP